MNKTGIELQRRLLALIQQGEKSVVTETIFNNLALEIFHFQFEIE